MEKVSNECYLSSDKREQKCDGAEPRALFDAISRLLASVTDTEFCYSGPDISSSILTGANYLQASACLRAKPPPIRREPRRQRNHSPPRLISGEILYTPRSDSYVIEERRKECDDYDDDDVSWPTYLRPQVEFFCGWSQECK